MLLGKKLTISSIRDIFLTAPMGVAVSMVILLNGMNCTAMVDVTSPVRTASTVVNMK